VPGPRTSLVAVVLSAALALAGPAGAAPPPAGALEGVTCIAGPSAAGALGCQAGPATLKGVHQLVLGPGDAQLYVVAEDDEGSPGTASLTTYARDPGAGTLTRTACRDNLMGPGCVADTRVRQPEALALAPGGADLYVADGALGVVHYRRGSDGTLTFQSCVEDNDGVEEDGACPNTDGLQSATAIAVSPDGEFVYVAAYLSNAVTVLDRNPADGKLTFVECWASAGANTDGCANTASGNPLNQATDVAMTADGSQLYASSRGGNDIVRFARNGGTGALSDPQTFSSGAALNGPQAVLVAPGGEAVYVGLFDGSGLTTLARDQTTGTPTLLGCLSLTANLSCSASPGVNAVFGLGLSVDGGVLYAAARNGGTLASFRRAANGALSLIECAHGAVSPAGGCTRQANGLDGVESAVASADGRFVYAGGGDALTILAPEYAPTCSSLASPVANGLAVDLQLVCSDRNSQPLAYAIVSPPAHGTVTVLDAATGRVRYAPTPGYGGTDGFGFTASDGTNTSAPATVTLDVTPDAAAPRLRILTRRTRATRRGVVRVRVRCLAGEPGGCDGALSARTLRRVGLPGQRRRILRLRRRAFHISEGARATVRLRMSRRALRILKQKHRLLLRASAKARDPAGNVGRAARRVTLLAP
jgi:6-phosphogluconolactonase (cycloisomerase 2 family)